MRKSFGAKTIIHTTPVWIVCAYDTDGQPSGATVAWGGVCSSNPPSLSVSLRAATYTHKCIKTSGAFTVNVPSEDFVIEADYFGIKNGANENKFDSCNLSITKSSTVNAPSIDQCPLVVDCELIQVVELGLHTCFVGEIKDVLVSKKALDDEGWPDIEKLRPIIFAPDTRKYYQVGQYIGKAFSIGANMKKKRKIDEP